MTATAKKMLSVFMAFVLVFTLSPTVAFGGSEGEGEGGTDEVALQTSSTDEKPDGDDTFEVSDTLLPEVVEADDSQEDDVVVQETAIGEDDEGRNEEAIGIVSENAKSPSEPLLESQSDGVLATQSTTKEFTDSSNRKYWLTYESGTFTYTDAGNATQNVTGIVITGIEAQTDGTEVAIPSEIESTSVVGFGKQNVDFSWVQKGKIAKVTIPSSVKFAYSAKFNAGGLKEVTFASGSPITTLYTEMFKDFTGTSVQLPDALKVVPASMFQGSYNITSIALPSEVTNVNSNAFTDTTSLSSVTLNSKLETIETEAFAPSLGTGEYRDTSNEFTSITIPASVRTIGQEAFRKVTSLATVEFAASSQLDTIGTYAFYGTNLTSVSIPNSVTSIGEGAFSGKNYKNSIEGDTNPNSRGSYTLTTVNLGSSQNESSLTTLGSRAFAMQPITSVVLPNSLTSLGYDKSTYSLDSYGNMIYMGNTSEKLGAFAGCAQLASITWPQGSGFTTVGGFNDCTSLPGEAVNSLPESVKTIDDYAFYNCTAMDNVFVPASVETIGKGAFSKPSNVTSTGKTFTLRNAGTTIQWDTNDVTTGPWPLGCGYTIRYPFKAAPDSSIEAYRAAVEAYEANHSVSDANKTKFEKTSENFYTVSGTVPNGAKVTLIAGDETLQPELDNNSFTTLVEGGKYVDAVVSLDGYVDKKISPDTTKTIAIINDNWTFSVGIGDMTSRSQLGALEVSARGDYRADCNVAIFTSDGKLVSQDSALRVSASDGDVVPVYVVEEIAAGNYTVVAWQKNDYFSRISSIDDFAAMGLSASDYARANVKVDAGKTAEVTLDIPQLNTASISAVLADGSVTIASYYNPPGVPFVATVSYDMTTGQSVDSVKVSIPAGMRPTAAATTNKDYGISGWADPTGSQTAGTLTISDLAEGDRQSGTISLALVADDPGTYAINATLTSGSSKAPIGGASVECPAIQLVVPEGTLTSREFTVHVYAKPGSTATLKIGDTKLSVADGTMDVACTTNVVGHAKVKVKIPDAELSAAQYYQVTATIPVDGSDTPLTDTAVVEFLSYLEDVPLEPTVYDFWFESAGQQVDLAKAGEDRSGGFYTVATSQHRAIFSTTWPFTAVIDSLQPLEGEATLYLGMLDNSVSSYTMNLDESATVDLPSGAKRYTYHAMVKLSDDDSWESNEIPCRFEVSPGIQELYTTSAMQPELTQTNIDALSAAINQDAQAMYAAGEKAFEDFYNNKLVDWQRECLTGVSLLKNTSLGTTTKARVEYLQNVGYDFTYGIFNNSFRHMTWDPNGTIWNSLDSTTKQKIEAAEAQVAAALDYLAVLMGNSKPMYEYKSFDAYLAAEYGYPGSGSANPEELARQGYTVYYDRAGNIKWPGSEVTVDVSTGKVTWPDPVSSTSSWYAVDSSGLVSLSGMSVQGLSTQSEGELVTQSAGDVELTTQGSGGGSVWSDIGGTIHYYAANMGYRGNGKNEDLNTVIDGLTNLAGSGASALGDTNAGFVTRGALSAFGFFWTAKSAADGIDSRSVLEQEKTTRVAELERINGMYKMYADKGKANTPCAQALRKEADLLTTYLNDVATASDISYFSNLIGTVSGGLGGAAGVACEALGAAALSDPEPESKAALAGASKICGAVSLGCTAVGVVNTMGTSVAGSLLVSDMAAHQANVTKYRRFRTDLCKHDAFGQLHYFKKPAIDPSGWTYEAVKDNPVEGVTATIYQKVDGEWVKWDATRYDQENPQTTTEAGLFAWDVPEGDWKVLFKKVGYLDKESSVMHVLPAWVNVAINMLREDKPEVASATGNDDDPYAPHVDITFNQYMNASDGAMPTVTVNGAAVTGAYWVDVVTGTVVTDAGAEDENAKVSLVLRVPLAGLAEPGDTVTVAIDGAYSYTGVQMAEPYTASITIPDSATYYYVAPDEVAAYTKGSNEALSFTFKRSAYDERTFPRFQGILVDGAAVDAGNYTAVAGSVVVTLKAAYLETLAEGDHTLTAQFADGSATADFKVTAAGAVASAWTRGASSPATGDRTAPMNALLLTAAIACVVMLVARNRTRSHAPIGKHTRR